MDSEEFYIRIRNDFFKVVALKGRGTISLLQREMKLSSGYFSQWRQGQRPPVGRLIEALNILGVDVHDFFDTALSGSARAGEEPEEEDDDLALVQAVLGASEGL